MKYWQDLQDLQDMYLKANRDTEEGRSEGIRSPGEFSERSNRSEALKSRQRRKRGGVRL
jgi:hypothetical protein